MFFVFDVIFILLFVVFIFILDFFFAEVQKLAEEPLYQYKYQYS